MTSRPRAEPSVPRRGRLRSFFGILGPGLVAGAADDDPSGIATYSKVGARMGTSMLWTALLTWPLMSVVQFMCARIGMVTGRGLTGALGEKLPKGALIVLSIALFAVNSINVGADLAGMSDAAQMLTGISTRSFVVVFGVVVAFVTIGCRYRQIAKLLKWLALVLCAYILTAFVVEPNWGKVLRETLAPSWPPGPDAWRNLVAILGTTISPYLFFWQASQEVEEEKTLGRRMLAWRQGATFREIKNRELDVGVGTFFSSLVMYFIMLTCALTLHAHGATEIETSKQAAEALRPLAGSLGSLLYTLGLIGVGLLAIPTLSGSAAYAFAETFHWSQGIDKPLGAARSFYGVVIGSIALGIGMDLAGIRPLKALYWTAILNGVLAPFLLIAILLVAGDRKIMRGQPSSVLSRLLVAAVTVLMLAAAAALLVS